MASGNFGKNWRNSIPVWAKDYIRSVRDRVLILPMVRTGWRPAESIPLSRVYFHGNYGYEDEEQIKADIEVVHKHSMASFERLATLWQQVRYLDDSRISGALVECGVWRGGAAGLMALAHMRSTATPWRELHLFDSFEGLPAPRMEVDGVAARQVADYDDGMLRAIGQLAAPPEDCKELLVRTIGYPAELVHVHIGWFQNTIPRDADSIGRIALLRLAGDWYESTRIPLQYLYSKVASQGVIAIADYGAFEGSRRAVNEFLTAQTAPIMLHHVDVAGRYWIKP